MIKVKLYYNKNNHIYGFKVLNHGDSFVCAGVSALVITCVNFIQSQLDIDLEQEHDAKDGGYISFTLPLLKQGGIDDKATLILNHMAFGLRQIEENYKDQVKIFEKVSE